MKNMALKILIGIYYIALVACDGDESNNTSFPPKHILNIAGNSDITDLVPKDGTNSFGDGSLSITAYLGASVLEFRKAPPAENYNPSVNPNLFTTIRNNVLFINDSVAWINSCTPGGDINFAGSVISCELITPNCRVMSSVKKDNTLTSSLQVCEGLGITNFEIF